MNKVPGIKSSAQARLILYRLFSLRLTEAERRLLTADEALWEKIIVLLEKELLNRHERMNESSLKQAFSYIDQATREGLQKQVERLTGQSLWLGAHHAGLLDSFVEEHLKLIRSVEREYLDKIGFTLKRGLRDGRLSKDLTKDIRQTTLLSKRRAQLIARNAPLQYSGLLIKQHQMSAGIKSYIWQSSRDERVRDNHRKYDGEVFSWDSGGPHPRSEVNCRCDAVPVI
jgi:SPP1 gp7 family putative phage head morphogenesis protein